MLNLNAHARRAESLDLCLQPCDQHAMAGPLFSQLNRGTQHREPLLPPTGLSMPMKLEEDVLVFLKPDCVQRCEHSMLKSARWSRMNPKGSTATRRPAPEMPFRVLGVLLLPPDDESSAPLSEVPSSSPPGLSSPASKLLSICFSVSFQEFLIAASSQRSIISVSQWGVAQGFLVRFQARAKQT